MDVKVPALSAAAITGKTAFEANCATCHGVMAAGTGKGPPFVHDIYNLGHHADGAFFLAVRFACGSTTGPMPPQRQVTELQVVAIVQYVRELQIAGMPHRHRQCRSAPDLLGALSQISIDQELAGPENLRRCNQEGPVRRRIRVCHIAEEFPAGAEAPLQGMW